VHAALDRNLVATEEVTRSRRKRRKCCAHDEKRGEPVARTTPHEGRM